MYVYVPVVPRAEHLFTTCKIFQRYTFQKRHLQIRVISKNNNKNNPTIMTSGKTVYGFWEKTRNVLTVLGWI